MFSVCLCARFQACPKESHVGVVKCIFFIFAWYNQLKVVVSERIQVEFH
jgi:hypothetical protein